MIYERQVILQDTSKKVNKDETYRTFRTEYKGVKSKDRA